MVDQSNHILSVVVPVFDEKDRVEKALQCLYETNYPLVRELDVIVVDDGSTDGTSEILEKLQKKYGFTLIRHAFNRGKGAALRTGIEKVSGAFTVFYDADLELRPDEFNKMLPLLVDGSADGVFGSRFLKTDVCRVIPYRHKVANRFLTFLVNVLTDKAFSDIETCYKMFHTSKLKAMRLVSNRFEIEPEITIKAVRRGYRLFDVAIAYEGRSHKEGKKIKWQDGVKAIWAIFYSRFTSTY